MLTHIILALLLVQRGQIPLIVNILTLCVLIQIQFVALGFTGGLFAVFVTVNWRLFIHWFEYFHVGSDL